MRFDEEPISEIFKLTTAGNYSSYIFPNNKIYLAMNRGSNMLTH